MALYREALQIESLLGLVPILPEVEDARNLARRERTCVVELDGGVCWDKWACTKAGSRAVAPVLYLVRFGEYSW